MPRKVSTLLAVVGAFEYALPPLRILLYAASLAAPWLPRIPLQFLCLAWCACFLLPYLLDALLDRLLPDVDLEPWWMKERKP